MQVRIRVDAERATNEFAVFRRNLNRTVTAAMTEGARRHALPKLIGLAPSVTHPYLDAKGSAKGAFLTTRGPRVGDRITGLLNYGGTVTTPIFAKNSGDSEAINTPWGPRAVVWRGTGGKGTPQVVTGKRFFERAASASEPGMEEVLLDHVMDAFGELGDTT